MTTATPGIRREAGSAVPDFRGPAPQLLLASQLIFNVGFYSVVPFLAVTMREDFGLGAMAIGIVLGARTFAQQGLFLFGGAMADRWGARSSLISGCLVRIAGYLLLVWAADWPLFLLGAVVTGIGGALFSPALESLVAQADDRGHSTPGRTPNVFALLVICGEIGAVAGPLLGALFLGADFDTALLVGTGIFAVMAVVFHRCIPAGIPRTTAAAGEQRKSAPPSGLWSCLREKRFLGFATFYSVNLLSYNQLYFGLPVELQRSGAGSGALAAVFAYASVLTITLQWPLAKLMRRWGPRVALPLGFTLQALGFAAMAAMATFPPIDAFAALPAAALVTALSLGHMCVTPLAMALVVDFAGGRPTGAFYGLLASAGGMAALLGNVALAPLYEHASTPSLWAATPWLLVVLLAVLSAVAIRRFLPPVPIPEWAPHTVQSA